MCHVPCAWLWRAGAVTRLSTYNTQEASARQWPDVWPAIAQTVANEYQNISITEKSRHCEPGTLAGVGGRRRCWLGCGGAVVQLRHAGTYSDDPRRREGAGSSTRKQRQRSSSLEPRAPARMRSAASRDILSSGSADAELGCPPRRCGATDIRRAAGVRRSELLLPPCSEVACSGVPAAVPVCVSGALSCARTCGA